jgi:hypothetical protein
MTQEEKRNVVSSIFVTLLVGIAFREATRPTLDSINEMGITWEVLILLVAFFLTTMRFFIGNQLHLLSQSLLQKAGIVWFFDFAVIVVQSFILTLLGATSSAKSSLGQRVGFLEFLLLLYALDVLWIASQWLMGKLFGATWQRDFIPWAWAVLNFSSTVVFSLIKALTTNVYSGLPLLVIGLVSVIAFTVDVVLVDYYDVI